MQSATGYCSVHSRGIIWYIYIILYNYICIYTSHRHRSYICILCINMYYATHTDTPKKTIFHLCPDSIQVDDLPGSLLSWLQQELMPRQWASNGMSWWNFQAKKTSMEFVDRRLGSLSGLTILFYGIFRGRLGVPNFDTSPYVQWSKDAMKGFNYDPPSLLKTCDLLCVAIGGLV